MIPEMPIGTRFTTNYGRRKHTLQIWELMAVTTTTHSFSGQISAYQCRAEDSDDWYYMQNPAAKIKCGEIRLVGPEKNIEATAEGVILTER